MGYEKKYKEALEKLRSLHDDYDTVSTLIDIKEELEHIFPELRESDGERIRKALIEYFNEQCDMSDWNGVYGYQVVSWLEKQKDVNQAYELGFTEGKRIKNKEWLEKQGQKPMKVSIWKHWKDGICGNGEGKLIYLIKNGDAYSLSSTLGFECDYIVLSELII